MQLQEVVARIAEFTDDAVLIAEAEPIGIPGPRIVWCNAAFTEMTGFAREDIIGQTPRILQGPDTSSEAKAAIREALLAWRPVRQEIKNYTKDGRPFWVDLSIRPVADANGWFHYWVAVQRDITALKERELEVERKLATVERSFSEIAERATQLERQALVAAHARDAIIITDAEGRVEWVNEAFTRAAGYTLDEMIGKTPGAVLQGPATDPAAQRAMGDAVRARRSIQLEVENYDKNGERYWIDHIITPVVSADGEVRRFIAVARDVTERKARAALIEAKHRETEAISQRLELATLYSNIGVWEWEPETNSLTWSQAMYRLFERDPGGPLDYSVWTESLHPEDRAGAEGVFAGALEQDRDGQVFSTTFRIVVGGKTKHIRALAKLGVNASGRRSLVGINQDITSEFETQALLERRREEAEAANHAKSRFLATMSHEIRTPMTGVMGMLDLLLKSDLGPTQQETALTARNSASHLLQILNDILDYSKLDAAQVQLEAVPVELSRLVDDVMSLLRLRAEEKGLTLSVDVSPELPRWISADPTRLRQLMTNLVSNAIKFTHRGGVRVHLYPLQRDGRDLIQVDVVDTGIGIAPEARGRLFQHFSQADASTTRKFGGTGLGLAISKQLAGLMGGSINVQSAPGVGSTFWFTFAAEACAPPPEREVGETEADLSASGRRLRILLAEDHVVNQLVVRGLLEPAGHDLTIVNDGAEAVEAVRRDTFDVVLMDVQMPNLDGPNATRMIRALAPPKCKVPIIALTANAMQGDRDAYLAAGMDDYVSKPIDLAALHAAILRAAGEAPVAAAPVRLASFDEPAGILDALIAEFDADLDQGAA